MRYPENSVHVELYYSANQNTLESNYRRAGLTADFLEGFNQDSVDFVKSAKSEAEKYLSDRNLLHTNLTEIIECFLNGNTSLYASFHVDSPAYTYLSRWEPYGMHIRHRYGIEIVFVQFWFTRYLASGKYKFNFRYHRRPSDATEYRYKEYHIEKNEPVCAFDFFGRMVWDAEHKRIDAIPLFLTNIMVKERCS